MRRILGIVALGLLVGTTVHAEGYPWWQDAAVQLELKLTPQQILGIEGVFQRTLPERRTFRYKVDRLESGVRELLYRAEADDVTAAAEIAELEEARAQRKGARTLMLLRMYRFLTSEQRLALTRLQNRWERQAPTR